MTARSIMSLVAFAGLAQTAIAQCPPDAPTGVQATQADWCGSIVVSWNEVSGANNYAIYRNTSNSWGSSSLVGASFFGDPQFTDIAASVGTRYYYWVTAKRNLCVPGSGTSGPSSSANGWRDQDPLAPTGVQATDGTDCHGILIEWTQPAAPTYGGQVTNYTIYRNTNNLYLTSSEIGTASGGARSYFDSTALPLTTYYYWVRAENQCGTAASVGDPGMRAATAAIPNETCATATLVQAGQSYAGTTTCATIDGPSMCGWVARPDAWYRFIATATGTLNVNTCGAGTTYNTLLGVYASCQNLSTTLACNDDGCANFRSTVSLPVIGGIDYYIRVSGASTSPGPASEGNFVLNVAFTPTGTPCYPNCDSSTSAPILNVNDFTCFLNRYAAGASYANCDASTIVPVLNVNDFSCFMNRYASGCP